MSERPCWLTCLARAVPAGGTRGGGGMGERAGQLDGGDATVAAALQSEVTA